MKVNLVINSSNLEVTYSNDSGAIDYIKNLDTGEYVKMFMYMEGVGYTKVMVHSFMGVKEPIYNGCYVKLPDYGNVSIPYRIFIKPDEEIAVIP